MNFVKTFLASVLAFFLCGPAFAAGYVDVIDITNDQFSLAGWACDSTRPNDVTSVHVWRDDGVFLAGLDASITRELAVAQACKSNNSNHGFDFKTTFARNLFDNRFHTVTVYSVGPAGNVEPITSRILAFNMPTLPPVTAVGNIELMSLTGPVFRVAGWACDSTRPNEVTGIHVWRDDGYFAGGTAPMTREWAIAQACNSSNSNHGFDISATIPNNLLDGKIHPVTVYSVGPGGHVQAISSRNIGFVAPAISITVTRTPSPMVAGQSYTLKWATTNATALSYTCTASGTGFNGSSGALAVNGSSSGTALAAWVGYPSTCTWTATGAGGAKTAYVETMTTQAAAPTITVTRTPSPMIAGQSYTQSWSTTNATSVYYTCTASGTGYKGTVTGLSANGSSGGTAQAAWVGYPSTCTWTASGAGGTKTFVETMTTVAAGSTQAPTITVTRTPSPMVAGQSYTLSWSTTNNPSLSYTCTASGTGYNGSSGALPISGSSTGTAQAAWVGYPSTCTWTATNAGGIRTYVETMTTVANGAPTTPTITVTRTPSPMVAGQSYTLSWSTTNTTSLSYTCTASGTGYSGSSGALAVNGSSTGTALAAWIGYPSTCTWTATGAGGAKTAYVETMTTQAAVPSSGVTYIHNDISGSPLAATDASGKLLWKENYRPYGERVANSQTATASNSLWFTGKPQDAQTGLSYMGARYYNPTLGRFMGIDPRPVEPDDLNSFNRYAYANNNPYRFVDPDGHSPLDIAFLVWDVGKLGYAIYKGEGVGSAAIDVAISAVAVIVPVPGSGVAMKAARATEHAVETVRFGEKVRNVEHVVGEATTKLKPVSSTGAGSAASGVNLNKSLASQAQMGEVGTTMAGAGSRAPFRDAQRIANEHGGNATDWVKKSSSSYTARDGAKFETHWVENVKTGQRVEFKTKFAGSD